jgi:hypothetical protein
MSNIYLAYSPNDFFYVDIGNIVVDGYKNGLKPTDDECTSLLGSQTSWVQIDGVKKIKNINNNPDISGNKKLSWDISCNYWFNDNSVNCIKYQLCKNKNNVNSIEKIDTTHISDYAKDLDNNDVFKKVFLNTINLGIGVLFLLIIITKVFNKK